MLLLLYSFVFGLGLLFFGVQLGLLAEKGTSLSRQDVERGRSLSEQEKNNEFKRLGRHKKSP